MQTYDIEVLAGNSGTTRHDVGIELVLKEMADGVPVPVDLTGAEAVLVVRSTARASDPLLRKTSDDGGVILTPVEGRIMVPLSVDDTRSLWADAIGVEVWRPFEIELRREGGSVQRTVLCGRIKVLAGVNDD